MEQGITVIIPAYNEEKRLDSTLTKVASYLKDNYQIIVVDDGSTDDTSKIAQSRVVRLIKNGRNRGKGYSVMRGIQEAKNDLILVSDADLSTPIGMLERMLPYIDEYDIAIGSRRMKESDVQESQSLLRVLSGKIFSFIVRRLLLPDIHDTQCGFKLFKKKAALEIAGRQTVMGFAFDVEMLYLADKLGYKIKEVPVVWVNDDNSKVKMIRDSWRMFKDLLKIKRVHG